MQHVLGLDLGTSSLKCVVMDEMGQIRVSVERSYPTHRPQPGWAEQDPVDWIEALRSAVNELRTLHPQIFGSLAAVSLCSAAHIPVLLDDTNRVIRPAILWSDQRSDAEVRELKTTLGPQLEEITLNEAGCTWTLPQLLWVEKHEPALFKRARRLLSSKDYLIFQLTGQAVMDHGSAAATLMLDAGTKHWSSCLIAASRLPESAFPSLVAPMAIAGTITAMATSAFGLPAGLPVIAGTLDSAAELLGCALLAPNEAGMVRVGSAGGIMVVTANPIFNRGIITYPHVVDGLFYKQAGTNACATSLKWIRDLCLAIRPADAPDLSFENLDQLASKAPAGADGLMFHPYIQGERAPYWNPELRGSFTGIDQRHGWPHFIRAVMEGVAFSLLDGLEMFRRDGLDMTSAVMSGGVLKSAIWTEIITDVLGIQTRSVRNGDSALGACMLAATAIGMFPDVHGAAVVCVQTDRTTEPNSTKNEHYRRLFARYQEVGNFLNTLARKYGGAEG